MDLKIGDTPPPPPLTPEQKDKLKVQLDYIRALRNRKNDTSIDISFLNGGVKTFT